MYVTVEVRICPVCKCEWKYKFWGNRPSEKLGIIPPPTLTKIDKKGLALAFASRCPMGLDVSDGVMGIGRWKALYGAHESYSECQCRREDELIEEWRRKPILTRLFKTRPSMFGSNW